MADSSDLQLIPEGTIVCAIDTSGSVSFRTNIAGISYESQYFVILQRIIEENKLYELCEQGRVVFVLWDDKAEIVPVDEVKRFMREGKGRGGTDPSKIVPLLKMCVSNERDPLQLVLITDGIIEQRTIDATDRELEIDKPNLVQTTMIVISRGEPNLSVAVPFMPLAPTVTGVMGITPSGLRFNRQQCVDRPSFDLLDHLDTITTIACLIEVLPGLREAVTARIMGRSGNKRLHDAICNLRERMLKLLVSVRQESVFDNVRGQNPLDTIRSLQGNAATPSWIEELQSLITITAAGLLQIYTTTGVKQAVGRHSRASAAARPAEEGPAPDEGSGFEDGISFSKENPGITLIAPVAERMVWVKLLHWSKCNYRSISTLLHLIYKKLALQR